jgi:SAM-dependent methyltransferase
MEADMRASMAETARGYRKSGKRSSAWGDPQGLVGMGALTAMALKNGAQNRAALKALDPAPGDVVLEIGCGPGMGLRRALKRVGAKGFVAGVDRSGCAVHTASHVVHLEILQGRAAVMRAEAADLPFRDSMFDKAFAVNSFMFWPDPARALREIARVLAPRGRLVITQRASALDRPADFPGAGAGMERICQAAALLKTLGWNIIDERVDRDGLRLIAASVTAQRPD